MSDVNDKNIDDALDDIFSNIPNASDMKIELPSLGKGYKFTKKVVTMRPMTFDDEKFIANYPGKNVLDELLIRCVSDIEMDELYLEDKLYLYYKLRECSFGSLAKISSECRSCGTTNDLEIDLSQLAVDYASEDFKDPKEVKLPTLNKVVTISKIRAGDQEYAQTQDSLLDNLWRFIKKVDKYEDPVLISKVIKKLPSADIRVLVGSINDTEFGLDTRAKYICNNCKSENVARVGLTLDFFMRS
tara:strand:+ start:83 stop:814 length:732 start_codon:yes stop_codon:yes gene_type:complete